MPSKPHPIRCPECLNIFVVRPDCEQRAIKKSGIWRCKSCTLAIRNKNMSRPIGSVRVSNNGYRFIKTERGWIQEHIVVIEKHIGRHLKHNECTHHIDGNKLNNDISNLEVMLHADHTRKHNKGSKISPETRKKISESKKAAVHKLRKFKESQLEIIIKLNREGQGYGKLAKIYNVSKSSIRNVIKGGLSCQTKMISQ